MRKITKKLKNKQKVFEGRKGITLIALVITIIVLLILAGVSIATLTGENGILTRANEAKEKTEQAEKNEQIELQKIEESFGMITQVTDPEPGKLEGEGTEKNPYIIQSIEDLVVFSYEVTNGRTFVKENGVKEYVQLGQSLDFESDKSYVNPQREDYAKYGYNGNLKEVLNQSGFITIGILEYSNTEERERNSFGGDFNGNGFKIYNMKIEKNITTENYISIGFFNANYGNIENIGIEQGNIFASINTPKFTSIASLVANNYGKVINCYATGEIESNINQYSSNTAGLIGSNSGIIKECYNAANVYSFSTGIGTSRVGGLVGSNEEKLGIIQNAYNIGNINGERNLENDSSSDIMIGGIVGYNHGNVKNSYTIGKVSNQSTEEARIYIGSITGYNNAEINNCYYLEDTVYLLNNDNAITITGEEKKSAEMRKNTFIEELSDEDETNRWKLNSNRNNGYPILYWQ